MYILLKEQILNVLSKRGLEVTKSNIRCLIAECKEYSWFHDTTKYQYNPKGVLFTEEEWDEFREKCLKICILDYYQSYEFNKNSHIGWRKVWY